MSGLVPVIPETAPFSPAQRAWLNGFLAGLYSQGSVVPQAVATSAVRDVVVLYGSQTGTSERLEVARAWPITMPITKSSCQAKRLKVPRCTG